MACLPCAKKSNAYCKKHARPHTDFGASTSACISCIEELVTKELQNAGFIVDRLEAALPQSEHEDLMQAARMGSSITQEYQEVSVLRIVASYALRYNQTFEQVVDEIIAKHAVGHILM